MKYWFSILFSLYSLSSFGSAGLKTGEVAEWLTQKVNAACSDTNCLKTGLAALIAFGQTDPYYEMLEPTKDIVRLTQAKNGEVVVQQITIHLSELVEAQDDGYSVRLPMTHSFLILRDTSSMMICDSFDGLTKFGCRPISVEEIFKLNTAVKNYLIKKDAGSHNSILQIFLVSQVDRATFFKTATRIKESECKIRLQGPTIKFWETIDQQSGERLLKTLRDRKKFDEEYEQIGLAVLAGKSLISTTEFVMTKLPLP